MSEGILFVYFFVSISFFFIASGPWFWVHTNSSFSLCFRHIHLLHNGKGEKKRREEAITLTCVSLQSSNCIWFFSMLVLVCRLSVLADGKMGSSVFKDEGRIWWTRGL